MAEELTPADVEAYTQGRLSASDPETLRALNAALTRARRYCGWHVSPVRQDVAVLDRPSWIGIWNELALPTLKVVSLDGIEIDGVAMDLANVRESKEAPASSPRRTDVPGAQARCCSTTRATAPSR
jgi:hypothetical protein